MNRHALLALIFVAALAAGRMAGAQGNAPPAQPGLQSFNVIVTNNIFDANRRPGGSSRPRVLHSARNALKASLSLAR